MRTFRVIVFETYKILIEDIPTNHSITNIQESIYHTDKSSEECDRMV